MDIQLKRGLLDVCVLAAIRKEDSYGYKIIKDLQPYTLQKLKTFYFFSLINNNSISLEKINNFEVVFDICTFE